MAVQQGLAAAAKGAKTLNEVGQVCNSIEQISQSLGTIKSVAIEITNNTQTCILTDPKNYTVSGHCHLPPQPTIAISGKEFCAFVKKDYAAFGVEGVIMYQIHKYGTEHVADLVIMFSVPFYWWFNNWFALGIYKPNSSSCSDRLFDTMYKGSGPFKREEGTGNGISYSDKGFMVKGTMSATDKSIIKIELWDE